MGRRPGTFVVVGVTSRTILAAHRMDLASLRLEAPGSTLKPFLLMTLLETGKLDPKQRLTFELVHERGETDASELMRAYGDREHLRHTTAWNNRLAALVGRGLLMEITQGRAKRYRPIFGEIGNGR